MKVFSDKVEKEINKRKLTDEELQEMTHEQLIETFLDELYKQFFIWQWNVKRKKALLRKN